MTSLKGVVSKRIELGKKWCGGLEAATTSVCNLPRRFETAPFTSMFYFPSGGATACLPSGSANQFFLGIAFTHSPSTSWAASAMISETVGWGWMTLDSCSTVPPSSSTAAISAIISVARGAMI